MFRKRLFRIFLGITIFLTMLSLSPAFSKERPEGQGKDLVLKVVDGDTLTIERKGRRESIRLIGIDAPESRANQKARKDAERNGKDLSTITGLGKEATRYVKSLVKPGDLVRVEFDTQIRDKYGRLLGYVFLSNGRMLNEEIVKAGYASLYTVPPNVKYRDRFQKADQEARENNRGLWSKY